MSRDPSRPGERIMTSSATKKIAVLAAIVVIIAIAATSFALTNSSTERSSDTFENGLDDGALQSVKDKASKDAGYTLKITSSNGNIVLDGEAVSSLVGGGQLTISSSELPADLPQYVGNASAYGVSFGKNTDFGNGKVTVSIPADGISGSEATVFCIDSDGEISGIYHATCRDGYAVFTADRLSTFAVSPVQTSEAVASAMSGMENAFGQFSTVAKTGDRTHTVSAPTGFAQSPVNTVTVYAGPDAAEIHGEMSSLITAGITAMGVGSTVLHVDGVANATVAKVDVTSPVVFTMIYLSINIGDVTVYAVSSGSDGADPYSGLISAGENADNESISEALTEIVSALDGNVGDIYAESAVSLADSFVGSYPGTAFGKFAISSGSDAASASAVSDYGSVAWTVGSDGAATYDLRTSAMDAKVGAGSAVRMDYTGCDCASVYLSDGKLLFFAYHDGVLVESSVSVGSASPAEMLEISDFIARTIGFSLKDGQAFTLADVVKDFADSAPGFENYGGTWLYDGNSGLNDSFIQYVYKSGMSGSAFFQINVTVENDIDAAYAKLRAIVESLLSESGPMGYTYSETPFDVEGVDVYAIAFHGGTMGGVRFVAKVGNILIDGSGIDKGPCADPNVAGEGKDYLYVRGEGTDAQNAQFSKILTALGASASKFGSEFAVDVGAYAKEFTNFDASKGEWSVAETGDGTATLRLAYTNSSGAERFTTMTAYVSDNPESDYAAIAAKVAALDGTVFLHSTVYSAYDKPIDGVTYTAVAYSGSSMGGLRFAMLVGNIVVDGSGIDSGSAYPYVYIDGGKDAFDGLVSAFLKAVDTAFSGGKIAGGEEPGEEIVGDDGPADVSAVRAAGIFAESATVGQWTLSGGDAKSAKLTLSYTTRTGDKTVDVDLYRKADGSLYETLASKVLGYDGAPAMGDSYTYSAVSFQYGDVSVAAVGAQLSSSYFLRFAMTYANVVVDGSSDGYVYLSGGDCAADVQTLLSQFAAALVAAAPADEPDYGSGAGYLADLFVKADTTGMWSHTGAADGTEAELLYTYVTSKGAQKTETVTVYHGSDAAARYATLSETIRNLIGTPSMGAKYPYADLGAAVDGFNAVAIGGQLSTSLFLKFAVQSGDYLIYLDTEKYLYVPGGDASADALSLVGRFADAISAADSKNALTFANDFVEANGPLCDRMGYGTWTVDEGSTNEKTVFTMSYVTSSGKDSSKSFAVYHDPADVSYDSLSALLGAESKYTVFEYSYDGVSVTAAVRAMGAATMLKFVMGCGDYLVDGYTDTYVYILGTEDDAATARAVLDVFASALVSRTVMQNWSVSSDSTADHAVLKLAYTTSTGVKEKTLDIIGGDAAAERFATASASLAGESKYSDIGYVPSEGIDASAATRAMGASTLLKFVMAGGGITVDASGDSINVGSDAADAENLVRAFENVLRGYL